MISPEVFCVVQLAQAVIVLLGIQLNFCHAESEQELLGGECGVS